MEGDYFLDNKEKDNVIGRLKGLKFDSLKVNKHYNNKFGQPRHGVTLEKAEEIFKQTERIYQIFTRRGPGGKRYSVVYRLNKKKGFYLILLLDNKPIELFDAYFYSGDIEKRLFRKHLGYP